MKKIVILDTSICSTNIGDHIIMDAVNKQIKQIFGEACIIRIPTHEIISNYSMKIIRDSNYAIIGGTNLLSSNMNSYNQWKVNLFNTLFMDNIILMGVGWWQYQKDPNIYTKYIYKKLLSHETIHSVRDNYIKEKLKKIGFKNIINTGCPTLWDLDDEHCKRIPTEKADSVLCTLTEYNQIANLDKELIDILKKNYSKIYFWPQNTSDFQYSKQFNNDFIYIDPSLNALDEVLSSNEKLDYIGTRLHAGIRAMQFNRRSIILSIDNRAEEMGRDFNLTTVKRSDTRKLQSLIDAELYTKVNLDKEAINEWKNQFRNN